MASVRFIRLACVDLPEESVLGKHVLEGLGKAEERMTAMDEVVRRGGDIDKFASRFSFVIAQDHTDFFGEIAILLDAKNNTVCAISSGFPILCSGIAASIRWRNAAISL